MMEKNSGKIFYLDGIRGMAALFVFIHHFLLAFYSAYYTFDQNTRHFDSAEIDFGKSVFSVFANGAFYVAIFFVLSGFVLSRKYFESNDFEVIRSAAHRRFLRLYIPVAFTIILSAILMELHLYFNVAASTITLSHWLGCFWHFPDIGAKLWHELVVGTMFKGDASFDNSMWTISSELYGSMFVFAFLALTHGLRRRFLMLVAMFMLYVFFMDHGTIMCFIFGISLNYVDKVKASISRIAINVLPTLFILLGLVLGSYPDRDQIAGTLFALLPAVIVSFSAWYMAVGAFLIVLAFVLSPNLQKAISGRFFSFLGYISFSFYLLHPIIIGSFSSFLFLKLNGILAYHPSVITVFLATVMVSFSASWVMAKYVDAGGVKIAKFVYERWFKKA